MLPPIYATLLAAPAVTALVVDRIYPHADAPQNVAEPYVTWSIIAGLPANHLSGVPDVDSVSVQVDCWTRNPSMVTTLAEAVRNAIEPYAHMTSIALDTRDAETKLYRIGMQFDWWLPR